MYAAQQFADTFVRDEIVTIALEDGSKFKVQKALLLEASDYFREALMRGFEESQSKELVLPGCSTREFQLVLHWVCCRTLPDFVGEAQGMPQATHDEQHAFQEAMVKTQCTLVRLRAVADMWLMRTLQDATMNSLLDLLSLIGPFALTSSVAFERMVPDSLLRTMLLGEVANSIIQFNHGPNGTYPAEQFESFSSVPGFFQTFARHLTSAAGANHRAVHSATLNHALRAQFMVSN